MQEGIERNAAVNADTPIRFDSESVRRILERAAEEQHRLDTEQGDSYSLSELDEMAAEAGISRKAVRAAIEACRSRVESSPASVFAAQERGRGRIAGFGEWSPAVRRVLLAGSGGAALFGLLLLLPSIAPALFWATVLSLVLLSVLVLLGASPF